KLEEGKNNAWLHAALGAAYAKIGRRGDAINELVLALDLDLSKDDVLDTKKNLAREYALQGLELEKLGKRDEAFDLFKKAHELNPSNPNIEKQYERLKKMLEK
ncbi:tetratricopeptide repeat protein, partial [Candidatus Woesearchaeota archaeon]|nr:tetratricopeptide repeat protein [Candidatus Woesearchaeota archaeon]